MRIRLKDFKCYSDNTFNFAEDGLSLLSGKSGAGKTTIVAGIYFALFGTGSKVVSIGKSSCTVELDFHDMKIVRTKKPNRLVLNDLHEDESAQNIINKVFGETFNVTGYISQNALNSFILMSPIDKLGFLEQFAFKDANLNEIKARTKSLISKHHDELTTSTAQLEMNTGLIDKFEVPDPIEFPLKCSKDNRETAAKNEGIKLVNCGTKIKRSRNIIRKTQNELCSILVLNAGAKSKQDLIDNITDKLNNLHTQKQNICYIGDEILQDHKTNLMSIISHKQLVSLETQLKTDNQRLTDMLVAEQTEYQNELTYINDTLWKEHTKEECETTIQEYTLCLSDLLIISTNEKEIINITKSTIDIYTWEQDKQKLMEQSIVDNIQLVEQEELYNNLNLQKELYSCPSCQVPLKIKNNCLQLASDIVKIDDAVTLEEVACKIKELKQHILHQKTYTLKQDMSFERILTLQSNIDSISQQYEDRPVESEIKEDMKYIQSYITKHSHLENKKRQTENNITNELYSKSYLNFRSDVRTKQNELDHLKSTTGYNKSTTGLDEENLRSLISSQEHLHLTIKGIKIQSRTLKQEQDKYELQIKSASESHIEKHKTIRDEIELNHIITTEDILINSLEDQQNIHKTNIEQINKWKLYDTSKMKYNAMIDENKSYKIKEDECRKKYGSVMRLKEIILEAESLAMLNIINQIDIHAQIFLDCFFPDNPLSARLLTFKTTKKSVKPQINIEIQYKGMECDLSILSGGELSRVILAYTLALGEMFNTPLLLLDECTASLDEEMNEIVFDGIKENFQGKMVLIIAHQCIKGVFDSVTNLT